MGENLFTDLTEEAVAATVRADLLIRRQYDKWTSRASTKLFVNEVIRFRADLDDLLKRIEDELFIRGDGDLESLYDRLTEALRELIEPGCMVTPVKVGADQG